MHPRYELDREYAVRLLGELDDVQKQALLAGIGSKTVPPSSTPCSMRAAKAPITGQVTLSEGRNREVRRMFEAMGSP